jgi:S1-C subfamily serine protease
MKLCSPKSGLPVLAIVGLAVSLAAAEPDVRRNAVVDAVAKVMPSVVNIATEQLVEVQDPFEQLLQEFWGPYYRRRAPQAQYSLGSGVIIDEAGYVLTNDHVIRRASRVWVKLSEEAGGKLYEAEVVNSSPRSDVALLRLKAGPGEKFQAVRFAADDDLLLGETVLALGNPFGLGGSVTRGILSSKSRRPPVEGAPMDIADWLQTDAAINPGNSGGPLINLRGEIIGLNVAMYRDANGIGFAIPIRRVTEALSEIFSPELKHLWLGARIRPGSAPVISAVDPGSPADRAGLRPGDAIVSVNGKAPRGYIDFIQELSASGDRSDVALAVRRGSEHLRVALRLVKETTVFNATLIKRRIGASVQELTPDLAERLGIVASQGLLVTEVDDDGPAADAGLQRGHVIVGVEGQVPENVAAAAKILFAKKKGEKVALAILVQRQRGNYTFMQRVRVQLTVR